MPVKNVTLYYREGSSDKVYAVQLEGSDQEGYVVNFQNGKRGSNLRPGTKTAAALPYAEALKIYEKTVSEKLKNGYSPGEDGSAFQATDLEERFTGIVPQLLNEIDPSQVTELIADPAWVAQEKFNGWRSMADIDAASQVTGINRKGLAVALPLPLAQVLSTYSSTTTDGERISDTLYLFDLLMLRGQDLRALPYAKRLEHMESLRSEVGDEHPNLHIVRTAYTSEDKQALLERVRREKGEGIVFKRLDAAYSAGRPASGGTQLKYPFRAQATVYVVAHTKGKRSVEVAVRDDQGQEVRIGKVTISPNFPIPALGELVEVRYLYAHKGGSLFQPTYLGPRDDVDLAACTLRQLKFKPDTDSESEEDS